jgi:hypothetical protein
MVETTLLYTPKEVTVRANLYKYRGGDELIILELEQHVPNLPGHGGRIHIQGKPEDMRKLFNVLSRVLRSPKILTKEGAKIVA